MANGEPRIRATRPPLSITRLMWLGIVGLSCACKSGDVGYEAPTTPLEGQVLFICGGGANKGVSRICILDIRAETMREYLTGDSALTLYGAGDPPRFGRTAELVYFLGHDHRPGMYVFDRADSTASLLMPLGDFTQGDTKESIVYYRDAYGIMIGVRPPGLITYPQAFAYGRESEGLYVLVGYTIHVGTPEWQFSADSISAPAWMRQRAHEISVDGDNRWVDLVHIDSSGDVTIIRRQEWAIHYSLAVSPDERWIAYNNADEVRLFSLETRDILIPKLPEGFKPRSVMFSSDGSWLAVEGSVNRKSSVIVRIPAPQFGFGELIETTRRRGVRCFALSPDGKWVMLGVIASRDWYDLSLVAVEIASGREIVIEPRRMLKEPGHSEWYVEGGIDWSE